MSVTVYTTHRPLAQTHSSVRGHYYQAKTLYFFFFYLLSLLFLLLLFKLWTSESKHSRSDSYIKIFIISGRAVNKTRRLGHHQRGEVGSCIFLPNSEVRRYKLQLRWDEMTAASCRKSSGYCYLLIGEALGLRDDTTPDRHYVTPSCFVVSAQRRVWLWATLYLLSTWLTSYLLEWNADSGPDPLLSPPPHHQITPFVSPFDFNWLFPGGGCWGQRKKKRKKNSFPVISATPDRPNVLISARF